MNLYKVTFQHLAWAPSEVYIATDGDSLDDAVRTARLALVGSDKNRTGTEPEINSEVESVELVSTFCVLGRVEA